MTKSLVTRLHMLPLAAIALFSALVALVVGAAWGILAGAWAAVITALPFIVFFVHRSTRIAEWTSGTVPLAWDVRMNNVRLGVLPSKRYDAICREILEDRFLMISQGLNMLIVSLNLTGKLLLYVPVALFWLLLVASFVAPEIVLELFLELRTFGPSDLSVAVQSTFPLLAVFSAIAAISMVALGSQLGFREHYEEELARRLRMEFNTPSDGRIVLIKLDKLADLPDQGEGASPPQFTYH
jgi:hypothetical protein